jgi:uroporphyrinogen decarboxylase
MNGRERMLTALDGGCPDRIPVTTHHVMDYFLDTYMNGCTSQQFFRQMGLDPIYWVNDYEYTEKAKENWRIDSEELPGQAYQTVRYYVRTPKKTLSMVLQSNQYTTWVSEHLLKEKKDIDILAEYLPSPIVRKDLVNEAADKYPGSIIRGNIPVFDIFGQPGCWQDLACIYGIQDLIMETYDDPEWVEEALNILLKRKLDYVETLDGCRYDILELGGGDASTTVISPGIFDEFVAPYDRQIVKAVQEKGIRVVYHTCGGMMPILENIADMGVNAMETFTPVDMGGDVDLAEAKRRIGDRVCMIGGFDQFHFFTGCTPEDTRRKVRECFEAAGGNGGFILSPSDHFFDAEPELIRAFADEAAKCTY